MSYKNRCEGWIKPGSFMTLGPRQWEQCQNEGVFMLTFSYPGEEEKTMPCCSRCLPDVEKSGATISKSVIIGQGL